MVNNTEGTLVEKSISWNVRKNVSIGCDQRTHLWQLNKEYTTQTVFYLLISFRHLFIILILTFNHIIKSLFALVVCACCFIQTDCWCYTSTISVNYIQGKPYYGQLNDTHGYHIKLTNSMCNMISCFHLKGPCSFVRGKTFFCQGSQILIIIEKRYQWKIFG